MMKLFALCYVALPCLIVFANAGREPADPPAEDQLAALERKLLGNWDGQGPCDGHLILKSDGTYQRRLFGPAGANCSGKWQLHWDALPPTLTLEIRSDEVPELVGHVSRWKLLELNDQTLSMQRDELRRMTYQRE